MSLNLLGLSREWAMLHLWKGKAKTWLSWAEQRKLIHNCVSKGDCMQCMFESINSAHHFFFPHICPSLFPPCTPSYLYLNILLWSTPSSLFPFLLFLFFVPILFYLRWQSLSCQQPLQRLSICSTSLVASAYRCRQRKRNLEALRKCQLFQRWGETCSVFGLQIF